MNLYIFFIIYQIYASPNQKKVFEGIDRNNTLYDYHPYEKIASKIAIGPYPENQIACEKLDICQLCQSKEGYQINADNIHLIGLHYGYKQEINILFDQIKIIYGNSNPLYFAFKDNFIYKEYLFDQFHDQQKEYYPFPQVFQVTSSIKLNQISLKVWLDDEWFYNIAKMNYTTQCNSHIIQCDYFYEEPINNLMIINGKFLNNINNIEIKKNKTYSELKILEMELPNEYFDLLLQLFFGQRFIELIEYENENYLITISENKTEKNLDLELTLEIK